jgi:glycosyltransferase involved in cell wall biosynthesis
MKSLNYPDLSNETYPLVSVLMPVFNGQNTIELAIKSLLAQTYPNWFCIIVNDCSTDRTPIILKNYGNNNKFKIIHLPINHGRAFARQIALNNAIGKYVAFLDADDFYHFTKLEKQVCFMENNPKIKLVSCGQGIFDKDFHLRSIRAKGNNLPIKFNPYYGLKGSFAGCLLYLQNAIEFKYNLDFNSSEDRDFLWRYLENQSYSVISEVLYFYSEFISISKKKIILYQFQALKFETSYFNKYPFISMIKILISLLKILYYFLILPITETDKIVLKRGNSPTLSEINEFEKTLKLLNTINY